MSTAVYQETYSLPAGVLALLVHGVFFALLYFGFSWQVEMPATMSVELWQSLPESSDAQPVAVPETALAAPVQPEAPVEEIKPDIVIPDKKIQKSPPQKIESRPVVEKQKATGVTRSDAKVAGAEKQAGTAVNGKPTAAELQAAREQLAMQEREMGRLLAAKELSDKEAALGRVVDEYLGKIASRIRRNTVMPPDVANDARAEFLVTLLPGGAVLNVRLVKSSGNEAYDSAVERAILKSQPLPLPSDTGMFNRFRELKLSFKPVE